MKKNGTEKAGGIQSRPLRKQALFWGFLWFRMNAKAESRSDGTLPFDG